MKFIPNGQVGNQNRICTVFNPEDANCFIALENFFGILIRRTHTTCIALHARTALPEAVNPVRNIYLCPKRSVWDIVI